MILISVTSARVGIGTIFAWSPGLEPYTTPAWNASVFLCKY
jgi:hypothetical protein